MQLSITQIDRSLSVSLGDQPTFNLRIEEGLLNWNWNIRQTGRIFTVIKWKFVKFFSSDVHIKIFSESTLNSEPLLLRYENRQPSVKFEYQGAGFQIVFHAHNRFSYFKGDTQFACTELKEVSFKGTRYESVFNEQVVSTELFLLFHLGLIYLNTVYDTDYGFSVVTYRSFFYGEARPFNEAWIS